MKIAVYCQHVLGIGHVHRSLEICRKLSEHHDVTMISGGSPLQVEEERISFFQLPGLTMDSRFNNLAPCDQGKNLDDVKRLRREMLYGFFDTFQPDLFLLELYPFGRKAFRFELDPVLMAISKKELPPCLVVCSLRDILVERHDREKFEARALSTLNTYFDGLLIHGDPEFIPLSETFSKVAEISVPLFYTGYVTPPVCLEGRSQIRRKLNIEEDKHLIVASIGGGSVGSELLFAVIDAFLFLDDNRLQLQIFTGPYAPDDAVNKLRSATKKKPGITVKRFTSTFTKWLEAADLAISMAGYNTTMNTLAAGVPALFYPFSENCEQHLRISRLAEHVPFSVLTQNDLKTEILAGKIQNQLLKERFTSPVNLAGAANTSRILTQWHTEKRR
ncbi:MAG: glycosyltransferase [Desulfopila sp.]|jgi:predicted glycosyltransferase|nr:glycosyltransferase [Desulfopila sp.]